MPETKQQQKDNTHRFRVVADKKRSTAHKLAVQIASALRRTDLVGCRYCAIRAIYRVSYALSLELNCWDLVANILLTCSNQVLAIN